MGFKVVITFSIPGIDYGEDLLKPFDAKVEKGFLILVIGAGI